MIETTKSKLVAGTLGAALAFPTGIVAGTALTLNSVHESLDEAAGTAAEELVSREVVETRERIKSQVLDPVVSEFKTVELGVDALKMDLQIIDSAWRPVKADIDNMLAASGSLKGEQGLLDHVAAVGRIADSLTQLQEHAPALWHLTQEQLPKLGADLADLNTSFQKLQTQVDGTDEILEEIGTNSSVLTEAEKYQFKNALKQEMAENSAIFSLVVEEEKKPSSLNKEESKDPFAVE